MRYIPYQNPMYDGTVYQSAPTIGSIGGYGYLPYQNGYYYNQYFNPYRLRQQQEAQRQMEIQETNNQISIWSKLVQCRNNTFGYDDSIDQISEQIRSKVAIEKQMRSDDEFMSKIHEINMRASVQLEEQLSKEEEINRRQQQENVIIEPTEQKSFFDWLHEDAHDRYMESQYAIVNKQQRNTSNIYDSNAYNQLLSAHDSVFNTHNALRGDVSIDDMEIQVSLPERLRMERDIRRQKFAAKLMEGMNHG